VRRVRISLAIAVIAAAAVVALLSHVAKAAYTYTCNSSYVYENSSTLQVKLCSVPNEAIFMNEAVGAYYINATTVELIAYNIVTGAASMNFTLINAYNPSQYETVSITGNGTATVWSNNTIVVFTLNNITFAFVIKYIPALTPPSSFTSSFTSSYGYLLNLLPLAIMIGVAGRYDERKAALGMMVSGFAVMIVTPQLGLQVNYAVVNFINAVYILAVAAILIMEREPRE
jgi:ABC-type uncharacterized transport system fused permease/ATPase subunit